ncbi:MAG: cob(I)yrinic acid a,c-diamide adenosyltransferase [Halobacteriales archaeon]
MPIYTGRGDEGLTDLRDMSRVAKTHPRIEAYGTVDEANSVIGVVYPTGYDDLDEYLQTIQNHLHIIQAEFANPELDTDDPQITEAHVDQLEDWIDTCQEELEPLQSFILPGGSQPGARLHQARAVCRRAERRALNLAETEEVSESPLIYLNRLSDALFTFARLTNKREGIREESPSY